MLITPPPPERGVEQDEIFDPKFRIQLIIFKSRTQLSGNFFSPAFKIDFFVFHVR